MYCDPYYDDCGPHSFWYNVFHWVAGGLGATIFVEVLLLIAALLLLWGVVSIISYFRQPFCFYCEQAGIKTRTEYADDEGHPECSDHYWEHRMAAEHIVTCPIHNLKMEKQLIEGSIIIDVCPHNGCVFLNPGELNKIRQIDDDNANTMLITSIAASSAVIASINASSH